MFKVQQNDERKIVQQVSGSFRIKRNFIPQNDGSNYEKCFSMFLQMF